MFVRQSLVTQDARSWLFETTIVLNRRQMKRKNIEKKAEHTLLSNRVTHFRG